MVTHHPDDYSGVAIIAAIVIGVLTVLVVLRVLTWAP
jgi:hypothetical protein